MSTTQPQQPPGQSNNHVFRWIAIEIGLLIIGFGVGRYLTFVYGPEFLGTFIYPYFHHPPHITNPIENQAAIDEAVRTTYLMIVPSLVFCSIILAVVVWRRVSWWKPLGFIIGCVIASLSWVSLLNDANYFNGRP